MEFQKNHIEFGESKCAVFFDKNSSTLTIDTYDSPKKNAPADLFFKTIINLVSTRERVNLTFVLAKVLDNIACRFFGAIYFQLI